MIIKRILITLPLLLLPLTGYAANRYESGNVDLYLTGGITASHLYNNKNVVMSDLVTNEYDTQRQWNAEPLVGFGIGHTFRSDSAWNVGVNVSGYYADFGSINGIESPFVNAGNFDTLNYSFNAQSYAVLVESRLSYTEYQWQPYALIGVGYAWNTLGGYSEEPSDPKGSATPANDTFTTNTQSAFAYEVGIGIADLLYVDKKSNMQYFLALDYRYMNLGSGALGKAPSQTTSQQLSIDPLKMQALTLSLVVSI